MKTPTLISLGLGGATALAGTGITLNHFYGGESIREHIERTKKSKNKLFFTKDSKNFEDIKNKYHSSTDSKRPKPKDKSGKIVTKDNLEQWCADNSGTKFNSDKDELYQSILSWCYINSNSFEEEMVVDEKQIYSSQGNTGTDWQTAWETYKNNKVATGMTITGDNLTNLNGENKTEGGKALEAWCSTNKAKKLYEDNAEATYELFKKWCTKPK
ncbi:hypothetical protein A6V39_04455 [Candidatus Mycoplasma haematobovis]|uniref:Uncharacterized protein n=1 Tax=Candidatus Mycoplasma haematobovis TaxID=432608 RepID=A0A1A9QDV8_9MOLU|nr:hypothetical protein [Candidatus Mycoplasma haematobovis]OAL10136.1 hypothetical protein A6V39_04455 [Candidatus Mycoplasma haematobovis]